MGKDVSHDIVFPWVFMEFQMHWGTWNYNLGVGIFETWDHGYFCAFLCYDWTIATE